MTDNIKKREQVSLSTVGELYSAQNSIVLRASGNLKEVIKANEPETIEVGLEAPKLNFLKNAWGAENVTAALSVFATDTAIALGFRIEDKERVIGLLVRDLMDKQPYYSLEDFMYFFRLMRRRELVGKTFGKEDWQVFYEGLREFDLRRTQAIDQQNKDLQKQAFNLLNLPNAFREKMIEIIPEEVKKSVNKEEEYKKAKIEFLKNRSKNESK